MLMSTFGSNYALILTSMKNSIQKLMLVLLLDFCNKFCIRFDGYVMLEKLRIFDAEKRINFFTDCVSKVVEQNC